MNGRRATLESLTPAQGTHAGLWLDKGLAELEEKGPARQTHIDELLAVAKVPEDYRRFFDRWRTAVETLEPCTLVVEASVLGRMVVGLGAESILETSITLHRTYGTPLIPGSALKGLAAAAAHKHLADSDWRKVKDDGTMGGSHRLLFGDTTSSGYVTFHDALWIPEGERLLLDLDVMTVHHPEYYQGQGVSPADWDNPVPVAFLSTRGRFLLAVTGPEEWANAALEILQAALEQDGIGAKTAAGYGRMKVAPRVLPERPGWEQDVARLQPGTATQEVPRILARLTGEERRRAALAMIERLGRKYLREKGRRDKDWVRLVFAAAES